MLLKVNKYWGLPAERRRVVYFKCLEHLQKPSLGVILLSTRLCSVCCCHNDTKCIYVVEPCVYVAFKIIWPRVHQLITFVGKNHFLSGLFVSKHLVCILVVRYLYFQTLVEFFVELEITFSQRWVGEKRSDPERQIAVWTNAGHVKIHRISQNLDVLADSGLTSTCLCDKDDEFC